MTSPETLAKIDDDKKVDLIVGSTLINPTAATVSDLEAAGADPTDDVIAELPPTDLKQVPNLIAGLQVGKPDDQLLFAPVLSQQNTAMDPLLAELTEAKNLASFRQADSAPAYLKPPALSVFYREDLSDRNSIQTDIVSALATPVTTTAASKGTTQFTTRTFAEITEAVLLAKPRTIFALPENSSIDDTKQLVADLPNQVAPVYVVVGDKIVANVAEVNQLNLE